MMTQDNHTGPAIGWLEADAITQKGIHDLQATEDRSFKQLWNTPLKSASLAARKKSVQRIAQITKPLLYDTLSQKDYKEARFAYFGLFKNPDPKSRDRQPQILCLKALRIKYQKINGEHTFQTTASGTVGLILPHAVSRLIQRTGERDFSCALKEVAKGLDWMSPCNTIPHRGSIFAPSEHGLICGAVEKVDGTARPIVKTFMDKENLSPENKDRWNRLSVLASMHDKPRIIAKTGWKKWHYDALQIMMDEGRERDIKQGQELAPQASTAFYSMFATS